MPLQEKNTFASVVCRTEVYIEKPIQCKVRIPLKGEFTGILQELKTQYSEYNIFEVGNTENSNKLMQSHPTISGKLTFAESPTLEETLYSLDTVSIIITDNFQVKGVYFTQENKVNEFEFLAISIIDIKENESGTL